MEEGRRDRRAVNHAHDDADIRPGINITNYDRLHRFGLRRVRWCGAGRVLDHQTSRREDAGGAAETFRATRYKGSRYGHPAPNDWTELTATMPSFSRFPGQACWPSFRP